MNFVGEYIKKQRNLKKINLSKVSSDLKISTDLLKKIENDEIDKNIDIIFHPESIIHSLVWFCFKTPVDFRIMHSFKVANRNMYPRIVILSSSL